MFKRIIFLATVVLFVLLVSNNTNAQTDSAHVYTVTTLKVPFEKMTEFFENWEKYVTPIVKKDEYIISEKILTHLWGPDWTVMVVAEYKNWKDIEASGYKWDEIEAATVPDKDKRDEIDKLMTPFYNGHSDAIVMDYPKLGK